MTNNGNCCGDGNAAPVSKVEVARLANGVLVPATQSPSSATHRSQSPSTALLGVGQTQNEQSLAPGVVQGGQNPVRHAEMGEISSQYTPVVVDSGSETQPGDRRFDGNGSNGVASEYRIGAWRAKREHSSVLIDLVGDQYGSSTKDSQISTIEEVGCCCCPVEIEAHAFPVGDGPPDVKGRNAEESKKIANGITLLIESSLKRLGHPFRDPWRQWCGAATVVRPVTGSDVLGRPEMKCLWRGAEISNRPLKQATADGGAFKVAPGEWAKVPLPLDVSEIPCEVGDPMFRRKRWEMDIPGNPRTITSPFELIVYYVLRTECSICACQYAWVRIHVSVKKAGDSCKSSVNIQRENCVGVGFGSDPEERRQRLLDQLEKDKKWIIANI